MKAIIIYVINLLLTLVIYGQDKGNLSLTFQNIEEQKGELYIGIYQKDNFLRQPTMSEVLKVNTETNQITFKDLPYGEYAISVYQDLNGNQQFDMDEYGRPTEPWVMSGNTDPNQMPVWDKAKIEFNSLDKEITLKLL